MSLAAASLTVLVGAALARPAAQQQPVFRATANYISTDVIVRDARGQFVADLKPSEFVVLEDGVEQKIETFIPVIGGRVFNAPTATPVPVTEGLIVPAARPPADTAGRIFIIFIDDMHLQPSDSIRARRVLEDIRDTVIHDNDLVGIVSTGYSSIEVDLTYDYNHVRLNEAIKKVMGSGMTVQEILDANTTREGPAGIRYNAHVAFRTAHDILRRLETVTNRRKAFLYVSSGYDFNPFTDSRFKIEKERYAFLLGNPTGGEEGNNRPNLDAMENPFEKDGHQFHVADLVADLAELARAANRANVTFYTLDPRGLTAGPDISTRLGIEEWRAFVENTTSSLRVLAEETGGIAVVHQNDFKKALRQIDAEMSDYYIIGYNSSNPDPLRLVRRIEIKITRPDTEAMFYRKQYSLKRPGRGR